MKVSEVFGLNDANSMLKDGGRIFIMDVGDGRVFVSDGKMLLLLAENNVSPLFARGGWWKQCGIFMPITPLPDPSEYTSIGVGEARMERDSVGKFDYTAYVPNVGDCYVYACSGYKTVVQAKYINLAARFGLHPWAIDPLKCLGGRPLTEGAKMSSQMIPLSADGGAIGGVVMPVSMGNEEDD